MTKMKPNNLCCDHLSMAELGKKQDQSESLSFIQKGRIAWFSATHFLPLWLELALRRNLKSSILPASNRYKRSSLIWKTIEDNHREEAATRSKK